MKTVTFISALLLASATVQAQPKAEGYQFTTVVNQKVTPVKNQAATGTCWCFATTSFIEAELLRQGKGEFDLSEMYIVRQKYMNQLNDNYLRHGKGNIGQGSISPSWFTAFTQVGIVPEEVYSGINYNSPTHNHKELASYMEVIAEKAVQMRQRRHTFVLRPLVGARFQVLFHSSVRSAFHLSLTVLVRYRSLGSI